LLVSANVLPSSLILFTLMMEAICSSETSVLARAIRHHITEEGILQSYRHENAKCYDGHYNSETDTSFPHNKKLE
jgi:hypothetical protein